MKRKFDPSNIIDRYGIKTIYVYIEINNSKKYYLDTGILYLINM